MIQLRPIAIVPFLWAAAAWGCSSAKPGDVLPPSEGDDASDAAPDGDAGVAPSDGSDVSVAPDTSLPDVFVARDVTNGPSPDVTNGPSPESGDEDAPLDEPCVSTCAPAGGLRCSTDTQIQVCAAQGRCQEWVDLGVCTSNQLCCDGACYAIDSANCYRCGNACSRPSPVCVEATRSCGCTEQACRAGGETCNTATGRCVRAAVYVDQTAPTGGDGTPAAPFRTIAAAISAIAADSTKDRLILVAAGTYDDAHGERFPLDLRGGLSLEGAGPATTKIQGFGVHNVAPGDSPMSVIGGTLSPMTTLVVGDTLATSRISHVSVFGILTPADSELGIFCDRGNLSDYGAATTSIEPNTLLDDVVLEGYATSLFVASSKTPTPSGCNIRITRSRFSNSILGFRAIGCDAPVVDAAAFGTPVDQPIPVAVDLGDGTPEGGNTFSNLYYSAYGGAAAGVYDCTKTVRARYNTFRQGNAGVWSLQPSRGGQLKSSWIFENNIFDTLQVYGLYLWGGAIEVSSFADNTFQSIGSSYDDGAPCAGLVLKGSREPGTAFPRIVKGRRNHFIDNDAGILIRTDGPTPLMPQTPVSDFGSADDPGDNVFACNSSLRNRVGGDVVVQGNSTGQVTLPFAKNQWDHATPTQSVTGTGIDGADILLPAGTSVMVDATSGTPTTEACRDGHVRGDTP